MATRSELIDHAKAQGLDESEADQLSDAEIVELYGSPDAAYQDQGSLDEPIQAEEPTEAASEVGTEELRTEARRRVSARREPFPWEVPPPKKR